MTVHRRRRAIRHITLPFIALILTSPLLGQAKTDLYGDPLPPRALARMGTVGFRHPQWLDQLAWTPDGTRILTAFKHRGDVEVWDVASRERVLHLAGNYGPTLSFSIAPSGKTVAIGYSNRCLSIWSLETGKELKKLRTACMENRVLCSPDGQLLVSGGNDGTIYVYEGESGKEVRKLAGHGGAITSLRFLPGGSILYSASADRSVRAWDLATGEGRGQVAAHDKEIRSLAFSPDGSQLAAGGEDGSVLLIDPTAAAAPSSFKANNVGVDLISYSPDGKQVVVGGPVGDFTVWDVPAGTESCKGRESAFAFSPDGKTLVSGGLVEILSFWEVGTWKERRVEEAHEPATEVRRVQFSPDGRLLVTEGEDDSTRFWESATGKHLARIDRGSIAFSGDGKCFARAGDGVTLFRTDGMQESGRIMEDVYGGRLALAQDASFLAAAVEGGVGVVELPSGKHVSRLEMPDTYGVPIAIAPKEVVLAVVSEAEHCVRLVDPRTGNETRRIAYELKGAPSWIGFSSDGLRLLAVAYQCAVAWEVSTGKEVSRFTMPDEMSLEAAWSPMGDRVAWTSASVTQKKKVIHIVDASSGKEVLSLGGMEAFAVSLAFSADGKRLASGMKNGTAVVWDLGEGK